MKDLMVEKFLALFFIMLCLSIIACLSVKYLGKDNVIEQAVEKEIEIETGILIDFTPDKVSK